LYNFISSKGYSWGNTVDIWTAASSDGINCGNKWAWCPNGTEGVADTMWMPTEPNSPYTNYCGAWRYIAASLGTSKLGDHKCTEQLRYICEVENFSAARCLFLL
jgi:hypothetical protein